MHLKKPRSDADAHPIVQFPTVGPGGRLAQLTPSLQPIVPVLVGLIVFFASAKGIQQLNSFRINRLPQMARAATAATHASGLPTPGVDVPLWSQKQHLSTRKAFLFTLLVVLCVRLNKKQERE